jgi:hypothetical protein
MAAADRYAEVLTDADVATLKHLADTGMGANTLRALASDLAYLEAWCRAATGRPLPWPADPELALKFIAHHLWDPDQKPSIRPMECPTTWLRTFGIARSSRSEDPMLLRPCPGGSPTGRPCTNGKALSRRSTIPVSGRLSGWP